MAWGSVVTLPLPIVCSVVSGTDEMSETIELEASIAPDSDAELAWLLAVEELPVG